ncbi:MAG TPA: hypothetical protein VIP78_05045, partial [Candidatus Dormibacteraeota bacterium]
MKLESRKGMAAGTLMTPNSDSGVTFPHCKMEPAWSEIAFAVDVSAVYDLKREALAVYGSIFKPGDDRLLTFYEAEDAYFGRLLAVAHAEPFRSARPVLLDDPTVILPV